MMNETSAIVWRPIPIRQVCCSLSVLLTALQLFSEDAHSESGSTPPNRNLYFQGKHVYEIYCMPCHGSRGRGDGELVTQEWEVRPRDLSQAQFKYRSTDYGKLPTNDDLKRTILHGINGSAMPAFHDMRAKDLAAVIEYIKHFSRRWKKKEAHGKVLAIPERPPQRGESGGIKTILEKGNRLFQQVCAPCHGAQGQGDGPAAKTLEDSEGNPLPPANLRIPLGCGDREADILRTIVTGMSGTAMPSFADTLSPRQMWQIVTLLFEWRELPSP
jgi:cytochrome c oxidase cbb3-type subunit I/II